jgi:hypothetical protein
MGGPKSIKLGPGLWVGSGRASFVQVYLQPTLLILCDTLPPPPTLTILIGLVVQPDLARTGEPSPHHPCMLDEYMSR